MTVIIPFYNDPYIEHAISSVLEQTYPNIEIIVVDDGSTQYQERVLPYCTGKVNYIGKFNGGTASALNCGIQLASGDYVAWLSSDDMFYPHKVENQLNFMMKQNSLCSYTAYDVINPYNQVVHAFHGETFGGNVWLYRALANTNPINGCTVMMKKELFARVGLFNEHLRFTQDYEFWYGLC